MYSYNKRILTVLLIGMLFMTSCQEKRLDRFERETKEYTIRNCPKQIDEITTLDSLVFRNDGSLNYSYHYSVKLNEEQRSEFKKKSSDIEESTLKTLRNSIELKAVKEAGLNIECIYVDAQTGKTISKFHFTREQYQ